MRFNLGKKSALVIALTGLIGLAGTAHAFGGHHHGDPCKFGDEMMTRMDKRMQDHLSQLKSKLNLTGKQTAAWDTFKADLDKMRADHQQQHKAMCADQNAKPGAVKPAPEAIAQMKQRVEQAGKSLGTLEGTVKTFYDTLNTEQKATFDQKFRRFAGGMRGAAMDKMRGPGPRDGMGGMGGMGPGNGPRPGMNGMEGMSTPRG